MAQICHLRELKKQNSNTIDNIFLIDYYPTFPDYFKFVYVTPMYKKKDKNLIANYKPI